MIHVPASTFRRVFAATAAVNDLDVGVIYTHERAWMGPLLSTLKASIGGLSARLLLVDNASADGVAAWTGVMPETVVLRNALPLSYAANLNRILAASSARYVLLLNTDMFFDPRQQCPSRMVKFMDDHPECGVAGCRLYHPDGSEALAARRFQRLSTILARRLGLGRFLKNTLDRYLYQDRNPGDSFSCDWLSGCFLMVRRAAFEQVGFFDECFGKYFEDVDMCMRMARAGWTVMYHGKTSCYHIEQRASRSLLCRDAWQHLRAYLLWLRKRGRAARAAAEYVPAVAAAAEPSAARYILFHSAQRAR
jgi:GT2 family glycosyltransferase